MGDLPTISPIITNTLGGLIVAWIMVLFVRELVKFIQVFKDAGMSKGLNGSDIFSKSVPFNLHDQRQSSTLECVKQIQQVIVDLGPLLERLVTAIENQTKVLEALQRQTDRRATPRG